MRHLHPAIVLLAGGHAAHRVEPPARIEEDRLLTQGWARCEARCADSGAGRTWRGRNAFSWTRHCGSWRIVAIGRAGEPGQARGAP